jgi:ubiquinone/menaquinone biosynthesis C-methylase UbiE
MGEAFKPISNTRENSFFGLLKFYGRTLLDFQFLTIYQSVSKILPYFKGKVLDIGCGQSPYRFLLKKNETQYFGIDIIDAEKFNYSNPDIVHFNGEDIPYEENCFDHVVCTEVLEHVEKYQYLVDEMYRVMKKGASGIITVPFSARYHYIPWDFFRYTPSSLKKIFSKFSEVNIVPRGSEVTVIGNKVIVLFFQNLLPKNKWLVPFIPIWILFLPFLIFIVLIAHLSLLFGLGSQNDPLGYTIIVNK